MRILSEVSSASKGAGFIGNTSLKIESGKWKVETGLEQSLHAIGNRKISRHSEVNIAVLEM